MKMVDGSNKRREIVKTKGQDKWLVEDVSREGIRSESKSRDVSGQ